MGGQLYHTGCIDMVSPWVCLCMSMHLCQKEKNSLKGCLRLTLKLRYCVPLHAFRLDRLYYTMKLKYCVISYFKIRMSKRKEKKFERGFFFLKKKKKKKKKKK